MADDSPLDAPLDAAEQRVLGSLMEKQVTVPSTYPLSLNALRTACNQSTSREPVTDYGDDDLKATVKGLRERDLVRVVWTGKGSRTAKYHQLLDDQLTLPDDERALLTVLLLRGAQAPGELRVRTDRLHPFADRESVEECLRGMAGASRPLVRELERQHGQHDTRWVHLLGPVATHDGAPPPAPAVDRESVLAEGAAARDARVAVAYGGLATAYADALLDELDGKPFDRWLLARVAGLADGPVVEVGCGPGQVGAFLAAQGADVTATDCSAGMVAEARRRFPTLRVEQQRLERLMRPPTAPGWGAVVAWYAVVHLAASELAPAIAALSRPLSSGGWLALALHVGDEVVTVDELFGHPVDLDVVLHDAERVREAVDAAGLVDVEWYLRGPFPAEAQTQRLYVLARRP